MSLIIYNIVSIAEKTIYNPVNNTCNMILLIIKKPLKSGLNNMIIYILINIK